jgi:hypothetical protein
MPPQFPSAVAGSRPAEPQAEQRPLERTLHDLRLIDEYAWLKAKNWREVMRDPFQLDPAIRAYLQAENDYCERALADTKSLQETLFAEMKGRIKEDDSSAPDPDGPYAYYVRYRKEGQHPLLCREPRNSMHFLSTQTADVKPEEQLLLDGDAVAHHLRLLRRRTSERAVGIELDLDGAARSFAHGGRERLLDRVEQPLAVRREDREFELDRLGGSQSRRHGQKRRHDQLRCTFHSAAILPFSRSIVHSAISLSRFSSSGLSAISRVARQKRLIEASMWSAEHNSRHQVDDAARRERHDHRNRVAGVRVSVLS